MRLLIVGGVAGGASAAARARRLSESAEIVMFEQGPDVSFANCGLPYFVGGAIADRDKLLVTTPERLRERFRLDVRPRSRVERIDRDRQTISIRELATGRMYEESYDALILATGAAPFRPAIPGIDLPGVFILRNLQDADRIREWITRGVRQAVLLGGGFIGLELAENLLDAGIETTVVERNGQILGPFDPEMTVPVVETLEARGGRLLLGTAAEAIHADSGGLAVQLTSGARLPAQLVVVGVGVRPENQLAVAAGFETGLRGGIVVNERLQTSDPSIYAVGDAIEVVDVVTGAKTQVPLAGPANRQGRIAAENALGGNVTYRGTQGTAIVGLFGCTAAMTGASEKTLRRSQRSYHSVFVHPAHHAGYYPGAEPMTLKVLFEPVSGQLLGAQAVGGAGVDKRIDVLAVALQAKMTVFDLEELELCYAPQFGSAKDPVNMAGFVAAGLLRGQHPQISVTDALRELAAGRLCLVDVRTQKEFDAGHIPGALHLPVDELRMRLGELPKGLRIAAYCQVGQRGYAATRILMQSGFSAVNVSGGFRTWQLVTAATARAGHSKPFVDS